MLARLRKAAEEREGGFTLIELLVVIIIIGILAAIAIPVFLNQRNKGYDAQSKSDLRNMATAEETYLTDYNVYTTSTASLASEGFKSSSSVSAWTATVTTDQGYCLSDKSNSGNTWYYSSGGGGVTSTKPGALNGAPACP
jgi:type IV pilus assembly protein PilA